MANEKPWLMKSVSIQQYASRPHSPLISETASLHLQCILASLQLCNGGYLAIVNGGTNININDRRSGY